jgi:hypothetical protein
MPPKAAIRSRTRRLASKLTDLSDLALFDMAGNPSGFDRHPEDRRRASPIPMIRRRE